MPKGRDCKCSYIFFSDLKSATYLQATIDFGVFRLLSNNPLILPPKSDGELFHMHADRWIELRSPNQLGHTNIALHTW